MDQNTLITILGSTGAIILSMFGMFLWVRLEANNDRHIIHAVQWEDRKDFLNLLQAIQMEIKDFHNRLCEIESQRRNK